MTTPTREEGARAKLGPTKPPSDRRAASRARKKGSRAPRGAGLYFMLFGIIRNCYRFSYVFSDCAYSSSASPPSPPSRGAIWPMNTENTKHVCHAADTSYGYIIFLILGIADKAFVDNSRWLFGVFGICVQPGHEKPATRQCVDRPIR